MRVYMTVFLIFIMFFIGAASVFESPRGTGKRKKKSSKILVFGHENLYAQLKKLGIDTDYAPVRPDLGELYYYSAILALSDDDMENMRICVEALHEDKNMLTVMRCIDRTYLPALKETGVTRIVSKDVSVEELIDILKKWK